MSADGTPPPQAVDVEQRVLVLAPFGRDARLIGRVLARAGIPVRTCDDVPTLCAEAGRGAGAVIVAEEGLTDAARRTLSGLLRAQPAWSDLPLVLMLRPAGSDRGVGRPLRDLAGITHVTLLERPVRILTLVTMVRAALQARSRQYQVREELAAREESERLLRESRNRFRTMADSAPSMIWVADERGRIVFLNRAWREFTGRSLTRSLGRGWRAVIHPDDRAEVLAGIAAATAGCTSATHVYRVRTASGDYRWVMDIARPRLGPDGECHGYIGAIIDIHERKQAEQALASLNAELERQVAERTAVAEQRAAGLRRLAAELGQAEHRERRRLATLLHDDLQQLLVAARLRLQAGRGASAEDRPGHLAAVDGLIGECLATARDLSRELSPPVLERGSLPDLLRWLAGYFGERFELQVEVEIDAPLAPRLPDPVRLLVFDALRELLLNVVKHADTHQARVRLHRRGPRLALTVEDGGLGFDPDRVANAPCEPAGFGLFNVRERLEAFGGEFEVARTDAGGARLTLLLPVGAPAARRRTLDLGGPAAGERPPGPAAEPLRVVVADDHAVVREGIVRMLSDEASLEVVGEAADGREVLDAVGVLAPHLVIMDVNMPRMGGIEATRRLKRRRPELRVIGLALDEEPATVRAMFDAGADAFVSKQASSRDLAATIRRVCGIAGEPAAPAAAPAAAPEPEPGAA